MSDIVKKRRRWPWVILAVLLLLVGAPIAWRLRPLNETERSVIGTWRCEHDYAIDYETFTSDRRLTIRTDNFATGDSETVTGTWYAANGVLYTSIDRFGPWTPSSILSQIDAMLQTEGR